jgi:hypothetical protein
MNTGADGSLSVLVLSDASSRVQIVDTGTKL